MSLTANFLADKTPQNVMLADSNCLLDRVSTTKSFSGKAIHSPHLSGQTGLNNVSRPCFGISLVECSTQHQDHVSFTRRVVSCEEVGC